MQKITLLKYQQQQKNLSLRKFFILSDLEIFQFISRRIESKVN